MLADARAAGAATEPASPDDHLKQVLAWLGCRIGPKYRTGQAEHGGRLWRKAVHDHLGEEVLDLVVYYHVLTLQRARTGELLGAARAALRLALQDGDWRHVHEALDAVAKADNLHHAGNVDGIGEPEFNP